MLKEFWIKNRGRIKPWYLVQKKPDDVIISASPEFLLRTICKELGISYLIASKVDPKTGLFNGENCEGEEKVLRFKKQFRNVQIDEFYSDSKTDTPLATLARKAFLVKGNKIITWKIV